jgi:hypothetical protein
MKLKANETTWQTAEYTIYDKKMEDADGICQK